MKNDRKFLLFLLTPVCILMSISVNGQKKMSLDEALLTGLKNNFDIRILRNQAQISKNNNNYGTAGFLPTVEADGGINQSVQDFNQKFTTGLEVNKQGAKTTNLNAGVELDWTVFNGFQMFGTKDRLNALDKAGMLNFKNQVEQSSAAIISAYYDIVRQQQQLKVLTESISISLIKLEIAKTKFDIGSSSKLDYLQAKVDMNADSTNLLIQLSNLKKAKENLKYLIGSKDAEDFTTADTIVLTATMPLGGLQSLAMQQNNQILAADAQKQAFIGSIREARGGLYPSIALSSRYNFNNQEAQAGFILVNQTRGLNYSASARWNIFEGGTIKTNIANAKINADIADINYQQVVQSVNTQINSAYADYLTNLNLVNLVKDNMKFAVENLDIATERYKIGKINLIDYRTAQLGYVNAKTNLFNAIYNAKNSEIQLMRLSGQISKEGTNN
jgi:outer membrane protein